MPINCACVYKSHVDDPGSIWTTTFELLFSAIIIIIGVKVNYRFVQKLKEEKRHKPLDRKGNVIEPIMRWFLWFQMIYWPYHLFYYWIMSNEIIPSDSMNGWWCIVMLQIVISYGTFIIAYNSLFVAVIRYLYIVHNRTANQLDFVNVGRWMAISSFALPVIQQTIILFTSEFTQYTIIQRYNDCIVFYQALNSSDTINITKPTLVSWTLNYLPVGAVRVIYYVSLVFKLVVVFNIVEAFLYFRIYQSVMR